MTNEFIEDDPYESTRREALSTHCDKCDAQYQVVRPGKIQPSCDCDYIDRLVTERDALRAELDAMHRRTSRHDHAKNLGQAVEGDAAIMARLTMERDIFKAELQQAEQERDFYRSTLFGCVYDWLREEHGKDIAQAYSEWLEQHGSMK